MTDKQIDERTLTVSNIKTFLSYDPGSGIFYWNYSNGRNTHAGDVAGYYCDTPRFRCVRIRFRDRYYLAHRLVWPYMYGRWPTTFIDHINHDGFDNRLCNLREANVSVNARNRKLGSNNTSGFNGVSWINKYRKWTAAIKVDGRTITLGSFDDLDEAIAARKRANLQYGFHENHGKRRAR